MPHRIVKSMFCLSYINIFTEKLDTSRFHVELFKLLLTSLFYLPELHGGRGGRGRGRGIRGGRGARGGRGNRGRRGRGGSNGRGQSNFRPYSNQRGRSFQPYPNQRSAGIPSRSNNAYNALGEVNYSCMGLLGRTHFDSGLFIFIMHFQHLDRPLWRTSCCHKYNVLRF